MKSMRINHDLHLASLDELRSLYSKAKYLKVDWHGEDDFHKDFHEIKPEEIDLYFYYTNQTGKGMCLQNCSHCFLQAVPTYHIPFKIAKEISDSLSAQGYNVGLTPSDSFCDELMQAPEAGSAYRISSEGKTAWTSGTPLTLGDWQHRLDYGWQQLGYRTIVMNGHETAGVKVPFKGIATTYTLKKAIQNIHQWNKANSLNYRIGLTYTIRNDNWQFNYLEQMVKFCLNNGISTIRFNCFMNVKALPEHHKYEITRENIVKFYGALSRLFEKYRRSSLDFSVSEDFGNAGIKQVEHLFAPEFRGKNVGTCRAGWKLFAITIINNKIVVVGCVDRLAPILGRVIKTGTQYKIEWNVKKIHQLRDLRPKLYGCWGGSGYRKINSPEAEEVIFG